MHLFLVAQDRLFLLFLLVHTQFNNFSSEVSLNWTLIGLFEKNFFKL